MNLHSSLPDLEKDFIHDTDACGYGIGAILIQVQDCRERERESVSWPMEAVNDKGTEVLLCYTQRAACEGTTCTVECF